jgi:hypothetical protein
LRILRGVRLGVSDDGGMGYPASFCYSISSQQDLLFSLPFYRGYDLDFPAMLCEIAEGELLYINLKKRGNNI